MISSQDFGISRIQSADGSDGRTDLRGSPPYMPPDFDQASGATFAYDVWSFGVVVVVLGTGKLPEYFSSTIPHDEHWSRVRKVTAGDVLTDGARAALGTGVAGLAERCLRCEASVRPSCSELLDFPDLQPRTSQGSHRYSKKDDIPSLCAQAVAHVWNPIKQDPWSELWLTDGLLFAEALIICRQQFGENHPKVALCLTKQAAFFQMQGKYDAAEPLVHEALRIFRQQLGGDCPQVAFGLNNVAILYINQGKYSAAEPLYEEALRILRQQLGGNHPDVATSLN
eukprot:RCo036432